MIHEDIKKFWNTACPWSEDSSCLYMIHVKVRKGKVSGDWYFIDKYGYTMIPLNKLDYSWSNGGCYVLEVKWKRAEFNNYNLIIMRKLCKTNTKPEKHFYKKSRALPVRNKDASYYG